MTHALHITELVDEGRPDGILKKGDVEITPEHISKALASLDEMGEGAADLGTALAPEAGLEQLRSVLGQLAAPYKRVVLTASSIHSVRRYRQQGWATWQHLKECIRQHRGYFRRRGVATSLDLEPEQAFGDKGVTGTANDRDVFLAFMKRIGLEDAVSPNAVAAAVMKGLRTNPVTQGQPDEVYAKLFDAMAKKPGQNVDRHVYDEVIAGTELEQRADEAYRVLCELTANRYHALNEAISFAHSRLQVSLTLEKEGIARFALNNPFGLATPYEGSLFRVYELDDAQHVSRVCPTFFTVVGDLEDETEDFQVLAVSGGGFAELEQIERFRIGEVYLPATLEQLSRVGKFAVSHCEFDVAVLADEDVAAIGDVLEGSGGAIRRVTQSLQQNELRRVLDESGRGDDDAPTVEEELDHVLGDGINEPPAGGDTDS